MTINRQKKTLIFAVLYSLQILLSSSLSAAPSSSQDRLNRILSDQKALGPRQFQDPQKLKNLPKRKIKELVQMMKDPLPSGYIATVLLGYVGPSIGPYLNEILKSEKDMHLRYRAALALEMAGAYEFRLADAPSPGTGVIEGSHSYPSEGIPAFSTCADNLQTLNRYCTEEQLQGKQFKYGKGYRLNLPPGDYYVFIPGNLIDDRYFHLHRPYFLECAAEVFNGCVSHEPSSVHVESGKTLKKIDPDDWYFDLSKNLRFIPSEKTTREAVEKGLKGLESANPETVMNSIRELQSYGADDSRVVPALNSYLRKNWNFPQEADKNNVAITIMGALVSFRPPSAETLAALTSSLLGDNKYGTFAQNIQVQAARSLNFLGHDARPVLPALIKESQNATGELREAIFTAIGTIDPENKKAKEFFKNQREESARLAAEFEDDPQGTGDAEDAESPPNASEISENLYSGVLPTIQLGLTQFKGLDQEDKKAVMDNLFERLLGPEEDFDRYSEAISYLGAISLPHLIELFQNGDPEMIRYRAGWTISKMNVDLKRYEHIFQKGLKDPGLYVRYTAAFILAGQFHSKDRLVVDTLIGAARNEYPGFQMKAASGLANTYPPSPNMISTVVQLLSAPNWYVRRQAYYTLKTWINSIETQQAVMPLLNSPQTTVKIAASLLLAQSLDPHPISVNLIIDGLRDKSENYLRIEAASLLAKKCPLDGKTEDLLRTMVAKTKEERQAALVTLRTCSPRKGSFVDALINTMLVTQEKSEQCAAAEELGKMETKAKDALTSLKKLIAAFPERTCLRKAVQDIKEMDQEIFSK